MLSDMMALLHRIESLSVEKLELSLTAVDVTQSVKHSLNIHRTYLMYLECVYT